MAGNSIPIFRALVITALIGAPAAYGQERPAPFRFFAATAAAVQAASSGDAPSLPQLRSSLEGGAAFFFGERLSCAAALELFSVAPSIPAGALLYRGYSGLSLKSSLDLSFPGARTGPAFLVSVGASAALARYAYTELAFLTLSAFAAPGWSQESGGLVLTAYLPVAVEARGGAAALSAGLLLRLNRARRLPAPETPR